MEPKPKYNRLLTPCNLSQVSLEETASIVGPSFIYRLYVSPKNMTYARRVVRELNADAPHHPFAPLINVITRPDFELDEWCIRAEDGEVFVGSEGC